MRVAANNARMHWLLAYLFLLGLCPACKGQTPKADVPKPFPLASTQAEAPKPSAVADTKS